MIAFFPEIYPDELLYSQISRYHQRSGYARFVFTAEDVFKAGKVAHPSIEFVNPYTDDAMMWFTKELPWNTLVEKHTMSPAYIRFLPLLRRKEAVEGIISCDGNWKNLMCLPVLNEKRFLRYCPDCAKDDREKYGETYWHRSHQITRIRVCPKHNTYLENSNVPNDPRATPGLLDAESNVPKSISRRSCYTSREIEFTKYVLEVFRHPIDLENNYSIGEFLHSRLKADYKNISGSIKDITSLYDDYTRFYEGFHIMPQPYMMKIFYSRMFDVYFVLQLAYFEGISVFDITHIPDQSSGFDELYKRLAKKHNIDYSIVADIGSEILLQKGSQKLNKSGLRAKGYERLDEELLTKVKSLVDEIIGKEGKPERVSLTKVQRLLNLPQKQFGKLPKCKAYIESKTETQEEYWIRKLEWAVKELEKENRALTLTNIMRLTNMRKNQVINVVENINVQLL